VVRRKSILEFAQRLAERFKPQKIILFGSRAYGRPRRDSDVDLLVIMPYRGHPFDVATRIVHALAPPFTLDLIIRTPQTIARQYREFDPLAREALDRGKVLYERDSEGVDPKGRRRFRRRRNSHARAQAQKLRRGVPSFAAVH
jgi:predicted nucleotidyltransferase